MSDYRWLNDISQQFLDRDYLVDGQTVDQRVDEICASAEKYLNKPGFGAKFKENFKKGWYSLSTPIWTNFGNDRGLPISCVVGETWVNTKSAGGKMAKDIKIGDEVLTHKGRYRKITNIMVTKDRANIYKLKISGRMTNLYITENHLVLTNMGWVRVDELNPRMHLVAINREVESKEEEYKINLTDYCDYKYLIKEDRICKKGAETVRKDRRKEIVSYFSKPFQSVAVCDDLAWAFGLWFAEGSLSTNKKGVPNGIRITMNAYSEKEYANKWLKIICENFGIEGGSYESSHMRHGKRHSWYNSNANSVIIGKYFESFGKGCKEKIIPDWIINLPKNQLECFLNGFILGDGSIRKTGITKITLSNPKLILQLYQIALKLGKDVSLQMQEKARKFSSTAYVYTLVIRKSILSKNSNRCNSAIPFKDGLYYAPIVTLEKTDKIEDVYDFTVEEDHSFSAAGVILHNCFGSSISDNMESIAFTWAEVAMMTKHGGGTSAYFGNLRPRGSKIKKNGESSGSVHFMQAFENLIQVVSQGSCYIEGTEVLTNNGFKDFRKVLPTDKLAQLDEFNNITFTSKYEMVTNDFEGELVCLSGKKTENSVSIKVTPNHRMVVSRRKMQDRERYWPSNTEIVEAKDLNLHRDNRIPLAGWAGRGEGLTIADRLRIAYQADGRKDEDNRKIRFHFSKKRKVNRLEGFLKDLKINYEKKTNPDSTISISFDYDESIKKKTFIEWVNLDSINGIWAQEFIEELSHWDGSVAHGGCVLYSSVEKSNIDVIQAIASLAEFKTRIRVRLAKGNKQNLYCLSISENAYRGGEAIKITKEHYNGKVYCAIVPEGRLLVRYENRVMVCGNTRRGNFAAYLPIDHADIMEFLQIRSEGFAIQDLSFGVTVPDYWMQAMIDGDVEKRKVWAKVLETRANIGYPYISFIDNANNNTADCYKEKGMKITHSNLCNEIYLVDNEDESFVCDLSSMNILYYDEWKDTDAVEILVYLLDAVMTEFIEKAKNIKFMERAVRFAERHRALGVGWLGWHSYLQSKMIPWESMEAKLHNVQIAQNIKKSAYAASAKLAQEYGEPEVCKGYGRRNTTLLAIAPTKSCTTPDTKFKDSNLDNIDYFEFTRRGGLDLHEIMSIECELDNGKKIKYRYDETIVVKRNGEQISIKACEIAENDIPTVKKIKKAEKQWLELNPSVKVFTDAGIKECTRFYFNGFEPTHELTFTDGCKYKFTSNHRLKNIEGDWVAIDNIEKGFITNNNLIVTEKNYTGILPTMDMEVPDVHYYVLSNGVHSHNSAFILGQVSEGIEPHRTNYYIKDLQKGKFTIKNSELEKLLKEKGKDTDDVWKSILMNAGSVQHLDFISEKEKDVFKTFAEISPKEIVIQAAQRQAHIDQGQSLNLMIHPSIPTKDVNSLLVEAWRMGVKGFYYQMSVNAAQAFARNILDCKSCQ